VTNVANIANDLDDDGRRLLDQLVKRLPNVRPKDPRTFFGYKTFHDSLGLSQQGLTYGTSLQNQGLSSLANWTYEHDLPAITGIIIDLDNLRPGQGYFDLFGKSNEDFHWWLDEVAKAKDWDWAPYLAAQTEEKSTDNAGDDWSQDELRAAVQAYLDMQRKERERIPFVKKEYYEQLSKHFGRSTGAFEYRMQNISYVLSLMGRDWLTGLKPAKNVGKKTAVQIEALVLELGNTPQAPVVEFEMEVRDNQRKPSLPKPQGSSQPATTVSQVVQFKRDPQVKAWVLREAKGICECCDQPAPFHGTDGVPFLEVHHVRKLAERGSDTVNNAVAICPNCHRALHYGVGSKELVDGLYGKVLRLIKE
jgi:predicted HNH restriction endonuclease